jgi:hypothetical protein
MNTTENIDLVLEELKNEIVNQYHEFMEFKSLYYDSEIRIKLLNKIAKTFFGELFFVLLERIILNVTKLTDPPGKGNRKNLSLEFVHDLFAKDKRYPKENAEKIVRETNSVRNHVKQWRDKMISHLDLNTAVGNKSLGKVIPSEIEKFYDRLQEYIEIVNQSFGKSPFPIYTPAYNGVLELVEALKQSVAFEDLFDRDPELYDLAIQRSEYNDA